MKKVHDYEIKIYLKRSMENGLWKTVYLSIRKLIRTRGLIFSGTHTKMKMLSNYDAPCSK